MNWSFLATWWVKRNTLHWFWSLFHSRWYSSRNKFLFRFIPVCWASRRPYSSLSYHNCSIFLSLYPSSWSALSVSECRKSDNHALSNELLVCFQWSVPVFDRIVSLHHSHLDHSVLIPTQHPEACYSNQPSSHARNSFYVAIISFPKLSTPTLCLH